MEKSTLESLRERAATRQKRILFPESSDARIVAAAEKILELQLATPILLTKGRGDELSTVVESVTTEDSSLVERAAKRLFQNREMKGMTFDQAIESVSQSPLLFSAGLLADGFADGSVAGSLATTAEVIRAGLYGLGLADGCKTVSSFFLMELNNSAFTYADCGVVPDPTAEQLAEIAIATAFHHHQLTGQPPRVAMLSFSTKGSAKHKRVDKVLAALQIARSAAPDLMIDGELQFDAAWVETVAQRKAPDSAVAGFANVFIFPDLDSGNIAYKITQRVAGATALGPVVQGFNRPFLDLSRGCSVDDIVDVAVIASVLAES